MSAIASRISAWVSTGDIWWWGAAIAFALDAGALASVWISHAHSRKAKTLWTVLIGVVPVIGALAWFTLGRERRDARRR